MNSVGFASTFSLVDLLEELPLPKALNVTDNDRITNEPADFQNVQELQNVADIIAPAVQMARLPSDIDRLRFKDQSLVPSPSIRTHHAQASPLMSILVNHYHQFQDIMTAPPYNLSYQPGTPQQPTPQQQQQQQQQHQPIQQQPQPQQQQHPPQQPSPHKMMQQPSPQIMPSHHHPQSIHPHAHMPQQPAHAIQAHQQPQIHQQPQHYSPQRPQQQQQQQHIQPIPPQAPQPIHHPPTPQQLPIHPPAQQTVNFRPQYAHQQAVVQPQVPLAPNQHQINSMSPQLMTQHSQMRLPPQQHMPNQQSVLAHNQHLNQFNIRPILAQTPPHAQQPLKQTPPKYAHNGPRPGPSNKSTPQAKRQLNNSQLMSIKKRMHVKRPEVVIDTKGLSLEEVLEKFVQETVSEQVGEQLAYNYSPKQLLQLVAITAKLKKKNLTKNVNLNKLTSLMITLSSQLQVQTEVLKNNSYEDETNFDNDDSKAGEQNRMLKYEICCDCAVTALNVMTSQNMDSRVYLEECVEAIVNFINVALAIITDTSSGSCSLSPSKKSGKQTSDKKSSRKILFEKQSLSKLTAKCSEVLSLVHDLLVCRTESTLNDSLLLSTSRGALTAFFLMDTSTSSNELQLNALNVITAIFAAYRNHQTVILEELIHSIARLPTTKRNRVQYQIGTDYNESISIFSALIMKLIQSLFTIRKNDLSEEKSQGTASAQNDDGSFERILKSQYTSALRASYAFVSSFLRRCCGVDKKDDCDYRVLFETFVDDLMTCLYKPDWSSAQLITHVLIKLLISNINPQPGKKHQQSTNQTLKLASLEHLGTICARLVKEKSTLPMSRKEVKKALEAIDLSSLYMSHTGEYKSKRLRHMSMKKEMLSDTDSENEDDKQDQELEVDFNMGEPRCLSKADEQKFWLALLTFCQREKGITKCGRNIFCAIWLKEIERRAKHQYEINNPILEDQISASDDEESNGAQSFSGSITKQTQRNNNNEEGQRTTNGPSIEDLQRGLVQDFFRLLSLSTRRLLVKSKSLEDNGDVKGIALPTETTDEDATIDEATASNIIKLLDISLPTTQKLIDASLSHIVAALSSTANTNIRSRAMKSLSHVLNDAPKDCAARLLSRDDLQTAIGASLLDQSTSVRESTVELIGRFILNSQSEALIDKYYVMLTSRIMDSGVSVRKRVIKILREICINYPNYPRVPEICSIIIKRINDEGEGIRKLVSETFTHMWFKEERTHEAIVTKVACITHVVATVWSRILAEAGANKSSGIESHFEWLHQLLSSLLILKSNVEDQPNHAKRRPKASESEQNEDGDIVAPEVETVKQNLAASTQIIAVLISEKLANGTQESDQYGRADCLAAMTTLWSFAKISPLLLTNYLDLFQSFLHVEPKSSFEVLILEKVIQIIELVLPSISNPSASTMNSVEANLGKLIIRGSIKVISVSVSCLSELIHRHTHNEQLANDMFTRFLKIIRNFRANPASFGNQQAYFLRALYTCGLLAKHFNIEDRDILYSELVFFVESGINRMRNRLDDLSIEQKMTHERILLKSLEGLGFMFERTPSLMLKDSTSKIYRFFMTRAVDVDSNDSAVASICVITNLRNYLHDEVTQEIKSTTTIDWSRENLKEMTSSKQEDANSVQSSVIQLYLRDILSCALSSSVEIRKAAIKLIHSVHNGGHINPLSIVPSLIALSSDEDSSIRIRADHILQEIERKYNNFVNMKSKQGVLESFLLNRGKRGFHRLDPEKQMNAGPDTTINEQTAENSTTKDEQNINITAKLSNLYSVVATNRQQRRAFINALLRYFDLQTLASTPNMLSTDPEDSKHILERCMRCDILQYVCDNLMFLPFTLLDEPFFLVHQIGITLSNLVSQAVSQFRDILQLSSAEDEDVEDEEEVEINENELSDDSTDEEMTDEEEDPVVRKQRKLIEKQNRLRQRKLELRQRKIQQKGLEQNLINAIEAQDNNNEIDDLPVSILQVKDLVASLHRCILLMHCKRVIWDLYGMTEQKFEDYTPNESSKVTDKPTHRRTIDEKTCEALIKIPQTSVHFDSVPFLRLMYADVYNILEVFENGNANFFDQIEAPNRHKLKLEYKRFSQLMTR